MILLGCAIGIAFHILNKKNETTIADGLQNGLYDAQMAHDMGTDRLVPPPPAEHKMAQQQKEQRNGEQLLSDYLRRKGSKLEAAGAVEGALRWTFTLQGGNFVAFTYDKNDELLLKFYSFASLPYTKENLERVKQICYETTRDTKYVKVIYNYEPNTNELELMLSVETLGPSDEALDYIIWLIFDMARDVRQMLKKPAPETDEDGKILKQRYAGVTRALIDRNAAPLTCGPQEMDTTSVGSIIRTFFDEEQAHDMLSLTAMGEKGSVSLTDGEEILKWNPTETMLSSVDSDRDMLMTPATVSIESVCYHYILSLHPIEQTKEEIKLRLTAVRTPIEQITEAGSTTKTVSTLITIRLTEPSEQEHFEYVYRAEEAARKAAANEEMSSRDTLLSTLTADELGERIYRAMELSDDNRMQRIEMLTVCYRELNSRFFDLTDKHKDMAIQTAFVIGETYWALRLYDQALYWLGIARKKGDYIYRYSYYQCLFESNAFYAFQEIDEERQAIGENLEKAPQERTEEQEEEYGIMLRYYYFMLKLVAGIYQKVGNDVMLEKACRILLEHESTREFAEKALSTIRNKTTEENTAQES